MGIFTSAMPSLVATIWIPLRLSSKVIARNGDRFALTSAMLLDQGLFKGSRAGDVLGQIDILFLNEAKTKALGVWMFMRFAAEHFLCFIEMVQFKERIIAIVQSASDEQNIDFDESVDCAHHRHRLYEHCPKSSIVFNAEEHIRSIAAKEGAENVVVEVDNADMVEAETEIEIEMAETKEHEAEQETTQTQTPTEQKQNIDEETVRALRQSAKLFFLKYIEEGAGLEINISDEQRGRLKAFHREKYASLKAMDWITIYDDVLMVLTEYIRSSYIDMMCKLYDRQ